MTLSQNGWVANDRSVIVKTYVPGTERYITTRKGDVSKIFAYFLGRFHREVEAIDGGVYDDWGYAERSVRGSTRTVSNHASGTGIDVNATRHVLGAVNTFDPVKRARLRAILNDCKGAIRWGGDYSGRKDEMHFEINVSSSRLSEIVKSMNFNGSSPAPSVKPAPNRPAPAPATPYKPNRGYVDPNYKWPGHPRGHRLNDRSNEVATIQARLGFLLYPVGDADGHFGPKTETNVKLFQKKNGLAEDGVVGPGTWARLFSNQARKNADEFNFGPAWPGVVLKYNSRGPVVGQYQAMMQRRGWNIAVDNHFGPKTLAITKQFQAEKRLTVDGQVGQQTWNTARSSSNK